MLNIWIPYLHIENTLHSQLYSHLMLGFQRKLVPRPYVEMLGFERKSTPRPYLLRRIRKC